MFNKQLIFSKVKHERKTITNNFKTIITNETVKSEIMGIR